MIDVVSLVGHLGATHRERIGRARVDAADLEFDEHGRLEAIVTGGHEIRANAFVFACASIDVAACVSIWYRTKDDICSAMSVSLIRLSDAWVFSYAFMRPFAECSSLL